MMTHSEWALKYGAPCGPFCRYCRDEKLDAIGEGFRSAFRAIIRWIGAVIR